jgi:hypothetical protein
MQKNPCNVNRIPVITTEFPGIKTEFYLGVCGHRKILFLLHVIEIKMRIQIFFLPQFETGTYMSRRF